MVGASPALFTADGTTPYFTTLRRLRNSSMMPSSFALYGLEYPPSLKLLPPLPPPPLPPLLPPRPKPTAVPETSTALILGAELLALAVLLAPQSLGLSQKALLRPVRAPALQKEAIPKSGVDKPGGPYAFSTSTLSSRKDPIPPRDAAERASAV